MSTLIRSGFVAIALATIPVAALAAEKDFAAPAAPGANAAARVSPGLWFTLKNECPGKGYATVGDTVCQLQIGTATFLTKVREGNVAAGYSEQFDICAGSADGDGQVLFIPPVGKQVEAVQVSVKPNSTVAIPKQFCE